MVNQLRRKLLNKDLGMCESFGSNAAPTAQKMFFVHLGIFLTLFLWLYGDYKFISHFYGELIKPKIFYIPFNVINLLIPICFAFILFEDFRERLWSKRNFIVFTIIICNFFVGIIHGNDKRTMETDILIYIAFFSGYSLLWLTWKSGKTQLYLLLTMIACSLILFIKTYTETRSSMFVIARYTSHILWDYTVMLYFLIGINAIWSVVNKQKLFLLVCFIAFLNLAYCGAVVGATRSIGLSILVLLFFICLSIYRLHGKVANLYAMVLAVFGLAIFVGYFLYTNIFPEGFFDYSIISDRIVLDHNVYYRLEEAADVVGQLGPFDFLLGRGIGCTISTILGQTHIPHVAILWFLLSFGLILFMYVAYILYLKIPLIYLKNIVFYKRSEIIPPILFVAPGLLAWSTTLLISGGISYYSSFCLGITLCFYENFNKVYHMSN